MKKLILNLYIIIFTVLVIALWSGTTYYYVNDMVNVDWVMLIILNVFTTLVWVIVMRVIYFPDGWWKRQR